MNKFFEQYKDIKLEDTNEVSQRIYKRLSFGNGRLFLVPINEVEENKWNHILYTDWSKYHKTYVEDLKEMILVDGLYHPVVSFVDVCKLIGGHHRLRALKLTGASHAAVLLNDSNYTWEEFKDKPYELTRIMTTDNLRPDESEYDKFNTLQGLIQSYKQQYSSYPKVKGKNGLEMMGRQAGFRYKKLCQYNTLMNGNPSEGIPPRPELWKDIEKGEKSLGWAIKTQKTDAKKKMGIIHPRLVVHDNLITRKVIVPIIEGLGPWMHKLLNLPAICFGETIYPAQGFDKSSHSTTIHNFVTKVIGIALNKIYGMAVETPDTNTHMDIYAEAQRSTANKDYQCETKAHIITGKSPYWTSGSEKIGYHILVLVNEMFDEYCILYGYIPENTWTVGAHGPKKLHLSALKGLGIKALYGEFDDTGDKCVVKLTPVKETIIKTL